MRRDVRASDWPFGARALRGTWRRGAWTGAAGWPGRRVPAPWSEWGEPFPGAAALEDVGAGTPAALAAARLAVARLVRAALDGRWAAALLAGERAAARAYIRAAPCGREEAAALRGALALARPGSGPGLAVVLCESAAAALAAGSPGGAACLWHCAYAVAAPRRWHAQAAAAAGGLEALARTAGGRQAATFWRRRAVRHARHAAG